MAGKVLTLLNRDRRARGLVPLRRWSALSSLATDRAANMATVNTLSHDAAGGSLGSVLTARHIQWYSFGEDIATANASWGTSGAAYIYSLWKHSAPHAALMFSRSFNYVGVGFAYRSGNGTIWASMVFSESRDHTRPVAKHGRATASGTTVRFSWSGHDRRLQTHTAGLRSFDVQMRRDHGTWHTIRDNTTRTSLTLRDRARGHWYWFRVQAADRRGNLSRWTTAVRVWVP